MKHLSPFLKLLLSAASVCFAADLCAQNLVVDGGFEETPTGSSTFSAAWTLVPPSGTNAGDQFSNVGTSATFAHAGENYANLAPEVGLTGAVRQTLPTTAGRAYVLSFFLANDSSVAVNFFRALVNGSVVFDTTSPTFPADAAYQRVLVSFVASGSSTVLEFQYRHDDDFWRLDDVAVILRPSRLLNISTRLRVLTGENVLIGGFILTGTAPKRVLVRAIGPSLQSQGVQDPLLDPTLELYSSTALLAENDNWKDSQQQEIEDTTIPPTDDRESAIVATLPANSATYTAVLQGKNGTTGVGLIEIYDLDTDPESQFANISSRGFVTTGENVIIGGFIVGGGESNATVVVRAIGPSLTGAGVNNALADPTLTLFDRNGDQILVNDNWKESQQTQIEETGLEPSDDRESALVTSVPAGEYTAIVRGKDGTSGVALVEIYRLP